MNVTELIERLEQADQTLQDYARQVTTTREAARLHAKAEGVRLALSYVREMSR